MTRRTPVPDDQRKRKARAASDTPRQHWMSRVAKDKVQALSERFKTHLSANALKQQTATECWYTRVEPGNHLTESKDGQRGIFTAAPWLKKQRDLLGADFEPGFKDIVSTVRAVAELQFGGPLPEGQQASHICHNPRCIRPSHIVAEDGNKNRSRNFCEPSRCPHSVKCLAAGPRAADVLLPSTVFSDE